MEEVGTQVAPPLFIHHQRFCDGSLIGKKRSTGSICYPSSNNHHGGGGGGGAPVDGWNPSDWDWDSSRFIARARAKPLEPPDLLRLVSSKHKDGDLIIRTSNSNSNSKSTTTTTTTTTSNDNFDDGSSLRLQLGGGSTSIHVAKTSAEDPISSSSSSRHLHHPNKKPRSGSPPPPTPTASYPMCQVDHCKEDLSKSKDYHRRHKVCEFHSKSTKALVSNLMQRFCQQCSRFHPLSEFDEGKRSCRRRLAGHNRRRRKTQPENATSPALHPTPDTNTTVAANSNLDIVNLLTVLARGQGNAELENVPVANSSSPDKNQLIQILSKINSLPLPPDTTASPPLVPTSTCSTKNIFEQASLCQTKLNMDGASGSTTDLLAVLSATLTASAPNAVALFSQSHLNDPGEKNKSSSRDKDTASDSCKKPTVDLQSLGGERSSSSYQSPTKDSDCQMQDNRVNLPLQLFSSSPENGNGNGSPPNLSSSRKYFSSDSSNPTDERFPSLSPPVTRKLFPVETTLETAKPDRVLYSGEADMHVEASQSDTSASRMTLELFSAGNRAVCNSVQSLPYQAGYTSSSSDHSPPSFNSNPQRDRTGRIIFKLFDKDPSHLPEALRTQIYNWLSNSPSEMESYIRPGCVVLSVYVSMPSVAWGQLEENLFQRVSALVQGSDFEFWRSGRFSVNIGRQLAVHKDGKIRLCKPWSALSSPELFMVFPLAVVSGEDMSLILRGRNLTSPGTKIHCTNVGGYSSKEVIGSTSQGFTYDEIKLSGFKVHTASPILGRCFIEVENGVRGNSFPVIIADAQICQELRLLECEFDEEAKVYDVICANQVQNIASPRSYEEVLHFLNELGWLFQRHSSSDIDASDYMLHRFQFLLTFSIERDYCALVKKLLDIFVEMDSGMGGLSTEFIETLGRMHLLHRAVKRRSRKMVDLLIHYSVPYSNGAAKKYIFPPNLRGPGGITPLHLAACTSGSYDIIDALTDDPMQIGLSCWKSLLDDNMQSPYAYAVMRNNHPFNSKVVQKQADRKNREVSLSIENEILEPQFPAEMRQRASLEINKGQKSCSQCATMTYSRMSGSPGLLHRPFIHSMLAIAAVCVCVCLFFKSFRVNSFAPFMWENLDFGTS